MVALTRAALADGRSVIIGLQSTGKARTSDVVAERGCVLDEFVSGPCKLMLRRVADWFPRAGGSRAVRPGAKRADEAAEARSHREGG